MEELQSTEILDREILEDARKKAHRILKTAEDTINAKSADWGKKLNAALEELEKKYAKQGELVTDEIMAHLPIDKHRIKAKKIEEMLSSAVNSWYTGLSRGRVLDLLKKELEKRIAVCETFAGAGNIRVKIHQIERKEAEALLQTVLPGKPGVDISYVIEEIRSASAYPEIILETPEARIYASISKMAELFLTEKRAELVEALLGQMEIAGEPL